MSLPRFFCPTRLAQGESFELPSDVTRHVQVRRLQPGDEIELFDGHGNIALARIESIGKKTCQVCIHAQDYVSKELAGKITLIQAMTSQEKLDWITEKATELGVARLIVVQSKRSIIKLDDERARKRAEHCQRIIESASEQCGRNHLMELHLPETLDNAIKACQNIPKLACLPLPDTVTLNDPGLLKEIRAELACAIFIGPEGGWDSLETQAMVKHGAKTVSLGQRILRTETAGLAAVSALCALLSWH